MKLRTRLREDGDRKMYAAVKVGRTSEDIEHDAMAAHALMRAITTATDGFPRTHETKLVQDVIDMMVKRADALLREWTEGVG